ncbi:MAG: hypothetical protein ACRD2L_16375, partial [Terriglobia bacterium]
KGQLDEALRFQLEALRSGSDSNANGLQIALMAHLEISALKSLNEDHKGALGILENLSAVVQIVGRRRPFYFYVYHNELAIELGELGRIAEAKAASGIVLASPFAPAYPNWAETRQELEAKRTSATPSIVAVSRAPEAEPSPRIEPQLKREPSRALALRRPVRERYSFQRSKIPIAVIAKTPRDQTTQSTLDRVRTCIGPRAPPGQP